MTFGAAIDPYGASFRLWAPAARRVALHLPENRRNVPMARQESGWHAVRIPNLVAGTVYQYVIDEDQLVPDPASRFQPSDVNGPSELIDPEAFDWPDAAWHGRPWHEAVIYEIHVGTFTHEGTFAAAEADLPRLANLGITAIELMPVADFAGRRNWGYDGVLPFAPDSTYGTPVAFKRFIAAAHAAGLMVLVDVVYNHFGPEGNYLGRYAPEFFANADTGWGYGINFSARPVRDFFIDNALYWIIEYNVDGLRLDAVHAIEDANRPDILEEIAARLRLVVASNRHVHLVLENDRNQARYLRRDDRGHVVSYDAQWNDDFHHAAHVVLTGETGGYYADFAVEPVAKLGRALAEGFAFQGEHSEYRNAPRGEPSRYLPPVAMVNFLQNHDQVGNRPYGERLTVLAEPAALAAATAILLLAPSPPLLFMGEEWNATTPFLFFCDFSGALGEAVRDGRQRELEKFPPSANAKAVASAPDPLALATFERSQLIRPAPGDRPPMNHAIRSLLAIRHGEIVPRLTGAPGGASRYATVGTSLATEWRLVGGSLLSLVANLGREAIARSWPPAPGRVLWGAHARGDRLSPWSVTWTLTEAAP